MLILHSNFNFLPDTCTLEFYNWGSQFQFIVFFVLISLQSRYKLYSVQVPLIAFSILGPNIFSYLESLKFIPVCFFQYSFIFIKWRPIQKNEINIFCVFHGPITSSNVCFYLKKGTETSTVLWRNAMHSDKSSRLLLKKYYSNGDYKL